MILSRCSCQPWHSITSKLRDKFLGAIINENLTWKNHIEVVQNKISKNIGVLYRVVIYLISKILKIYFSFAAIYISYANIAWASTFKTKLQGIVKKQTCCTNNFSCKQISPFETIIKRDKSFKCSSNQSNSNSKIYAQNYGINPRIFLPKFSEVDHQYSTRLSQNRFYYKRSACKIANLPITLRGPTIWNSFLGQHVKSIAHLLSSLKQTKFKLFNSNKE